MVKEKAKTTKKKVPVKKKKMPVKKTVKPKEKKQKKVEAISRIRVEYFEATGRRKTSVARVRLYNKKSGLVTINEKKLEQYLPTEALQKTALSALDKMKSLDRFEVMVVVRGGGISSQAEAIRHGIARALVLSNSEYKKRLKKSGFLTRDSRMKERKKFGLKRARRAPQWSKR